MLAVRRVVEPYWLVGRKERKVGVVMVLRKRCVLMSESFIGEYV